MILCIVLSQFAQYTEQKLQESGASIVTNQNFANNDPHVALEQIKVHYGYTDHELVKYLRILFIV